MTTEARISAYELRELLSSDIHLSLWLQEQAALAIVGHGKTIDNDPIANWLRDCGAQRVLVLMSRIEVDGVSTPTPRWARELIPMLDARGPVEITATLALALLHRARAIDARRAPRSSAAPAAWQTVVRGGPQLTTPPPIRALGSRRVWTIDDTLDALSVGAIVLVAGWLAWQALRGVYGWQA